MLSGLGTNIAFPLKGLIGDRIIGALLMATASLLLAGMGVTIKLLGPGFHVWDVAMYRYGGGLLLLLLTTGKLTGFFKPHRPVMMTARGLAGAIAFISFVTALHRIPFTTAIVLYFTFPGFAAFFSGLFFGEKITLFEIGCLALAICGAGALFGFRVEGDVLGLSLALTSGVFGGIGAALVKKLRATNGPAMISFHLFLVGAIINFFPFAANPRLPGTSLEWMLALMIIIISTVGQMIMNQGYHYCKSWEGGLYMNSELIFAIMLGVFFFNEQLTWRFWAGSGLIFCSALSLSLRPLLTESKSQVCGGDSGRING